LPAASFRPRLAAAALADKLTVPPVGSVEDFHLQVGAPCRAHKTKALRSTDRRASFHICGANDVVTQTLLVNKIRLAIAGLDFVRDELE
jgi:hypothetical protein